MNQSISPINQSNQEIDQERKLKRLWKLRKKKALDASKNPGQTNQYHAGQDFKNKLLVFLLTIVTTIGLFIIMFWNEDT
jgi:hypothetical protein